MQKQKGISTLVGIIIILAVAVLLFGGVFVYGNFESRQTKSEAVSPALSKQQILNKTFPLAGEPANQVDQTAGMQKYTDSNFGFSFWYPNTWQIEDSKINNPNIYSGGTVIKKLNIYNGQPAVAEAPNPPVVTIEEFTSPILSITDSTGVGACPVCVPMHYYFDPSIHTWMIEYPNGTPMGPKSPSPADISLNTMGGLHMFPGSDRFFGNVIVPLSARNFVVVSVDGAIATGSADAQALAKTIVALDLSVATPVSSSAQQTVIENEARAYKGF